MGKLGVFLALLLAMSIVAAQTQSMLTGVQRTVSQLCSDLYTLMPVVAMLMVVFAGVIYASGQMMGAETRARANVWATAALTGALIAILIVTVAKPVLQAIYHQNGFEIQCGNPLVGEYST
jgi:cell shape-determining protein MreD